MFCPALTLAGPVFVMARSACGPTLVVALAVLLFGFGSLVVAETVAVFVTLPLKFADVLYVAVMITAWPALSDPIVVETVPGQLLQDTNVSCVGVGSERTTPAAVDGPLLVTVIV